jgi:hypothetical protein
MIEAGSTINSGRAGMTWFRSGTIHALEGRLRVKVAGVKGSVERARDVERTLRRACSGIEKIDANPRTGSVLILYDPDETAQWEIIAAVGRIGPLDLPFLSRRDGMIRAVARSVVHSTLELAVQRLFYVLT